MHWLPPFSCTLPFHHHQAAMFMVMVMILIKKDYISAMERWLLPTQTTCAMQKINLNIGAYSLQRSNKPDNHKTPAGAKPKESWYQKSSDEVAENFATTCVWAASCRRRPNLNRGAQHNAQPTCLACWPGLVGEEHYGHEHHDIHRDHFQHHHHCYDLPAPSLSGHRSSDSCILPLILLLP